MNVLRAHLPHDRRPSGFAAGLAAALLAVSLPSVGSSAWAAQAPPTAEVPTILVSRQLAEAEQIAVGDEVELTTDPAAGTRRRFRVAGIYEPTPDPLRFTARRLEARLHLPDFQALTTNPDDPVEAEAVGGINIALAPAADPATFAADLAARVPGLTASTVAGDDTRAGPFVVLERFHWAIAIVTILGSAIFLLALMVMLAEERRETIGTLRLIGLSTRRVVVQVLAEGALIALVGAAFGVAFALATEGLFNRFFQWRYDTALVFVRITAKVVWQCVAIAVPLGVVATLVASRTLLRRSLLELVRR